MTVEIRIFLGCRQTKELKMHLNQSSLWKEAKDLGSSHLVEVCWKEHDYIGMHVPSALPCKSIGEEESAIKSQLQLYCPKLILSKHPFYLFPQIFLH